MKVNICGMLHDVVECKDNFDADCHFAQIEYKKCKIAVNSDMTEENKKEAICHEMMHGILLHLGYNDLCNDEQFVQAMANAVYQSFTIKDFEKKKTENSK